MKKLILSFLLLTAGAAFAQQQYPGEPGMADGRGAYPPPPPAGAPMAAPAYSFPKFTVPVISTTPAYQTEMRERKVCDRAAASGGTSVAGTILGGVAGGILGNQVGRGKGRTVATAAGAVGGAVAGNAIANSMENTPTCRTVSEPQPVLVGYDVAYDFYGQRGLVRMAQSPGASIVVEVRPAGL